MQIKTIAFMHNFIDRHVVSCVFFVPMSLFIHDLILKLKTEFGI